jgi:hypothetical protein
MIKNKSRTLVLLAAGFLLTSLVQAQDSANSSGGNATGSGGMVSYSIGQVFYTSNSNSNGEVAQGVQHAYEIFTVGVTETELNISLLVFPNPTADDLTLQIIDYNNEILTYQLFDIQGKLLSKGQVIGNQTQINTANIPSDTYFISVLNQKKQKVQSFKIIKKS